MLIKTSQSDTLIKERGIVSGIIGRSVAVVAPSVPNLNLFLPENLQVKMYLTQGSRNLVMVSNNVRFLAIASNCNDSNLQYTAVDNVGYLEDSTHVVFNWAISFPIGFVIPTGASVSFEFMSSGSEWDAKVNAVDSWHEIDFFETSLVGLDLPYIETINIKANETQSDYQSSGRVCKAVLVNIDKTTNDVSDRVVTSSNVSGTINNNFTVRGIDSYQGNFIDKDNIALLLQSRVIFLERTPIADFKVSLGFNGGNVSGGKNALVVFGTKTI